MATDDPSETATNETPSWFVTSVYPYIKASLIQCQEYSRSTLLESIQWVRWWCHCPPKPLKHKPQSYIQTVANEAVKMADHVVPSKGAVKNLTDKLLGPDLKNDDGISRNLTLAALKIVILTLVIVLILYFIFGVRRMISRYRHTVQLEKYATAVDQIGNPMDLPTHEPKKENFCKRRTIKHFTKPSKTSFLQPLPDTIALNGLTPRATSANQQKLLSNNLKAMSCEETVLPLEKQKPGTAPTTLSKNSSLSPVTNFFTTKLKSSFTANSACTTAVAAIPTTPNANTSAKSVNLDFESVKKSVISKDSISTTQVTASTSLQSTASTPLTITKAPSPMVEKPSSKISVSKKGKKKHKKKCKTKKSADNDEVATLIPTPKTVSHRSSTNSLIASPKRAQSLCRTPKEVKIKPSSTTANLKSLLVDGKDTLFEAKTESTTKPGSDTVVTSTSTVSPPKHNSDDSEKSFVTPKSPNDKLETSLKKSATDPTQSISIREAPATPVVTPVSSSESFKITTCSLLKQALMNEDGHISDLVPTTSNASLVNSKLAGKKTLTSYNNGTELLPKAVEVLKNESKTTKSLAAESGKPTELKSELRTNGQFSDGKASTPPKTLQEIDNKIPSRHGAGCDADTASSNQSCDSFTSNIICTCDECVRYRNEEHSRSKGRMVAGKAACEAKEFISTQQDRFIQMQKRLRQNATSIGILQMYPRGSTVAGCPECQTRPLHPITFRWYDDEPQSVFLTGSFVGWQSKIPMHRCIEHRGRNVRSSGFYLELRLPRGHHEYKFIVDKRWAVDEKRQPTIKTREGHLHHFIHV